VAMVEGNSHIISSVLKWGEEDDLIAEEWVIEEEKALAGRRMQQLKEEEYSHVEREREKRALPRAVLEVSSSHCTNTLKAASYTYMPVCTQNVTTLFGFSSALLSFALDMTNSPRYSLAAPTESAGPNLEREQALPQRPHSQRHDPTCVPGLLGAAAIVIPSYEHSV